MNFKLNTKHAILKCTTIFCAAFLLFFSFQSSSVEAFPNRGNKSPPFNGLNNVDHHPSPANLQNWFDSMFFKDNAAAEKLHVLDLDLMQDFELDYKLQHIGSHESPSAPPIADTQKEYIQYVGNSVSLIETGDQFLLNLLLPGHDGKSVSVAIEKTHPADHGPATNVLIISPKDHTQFDEKHFEIDSKVDTDTISVTFDKGILSITAIKNQVKVERLELKINSGGEKEGEEVNAKKNLDEKKDEKKDAPAPADAAKVDEEESSGIDIIDDEE